jgi:acyl transferase domain-containing protein
MAAQIELIEACYKRAGLDMADTGYVEAHMTGTQTGDVIEAEAIATTFGRAQKADPILVGSVKTIVGHTEPVSGLAAFIKTVLAIKHRQIPPNRNYEVTNPNIKLDKWCLQVS